MKTHGAVGKHITMIGVYSDSFPALCHCLSNGAGSARAFILTLFFRDHALQLIQPVVSVTEVVKIGMLLSAARTAIMIPFQTRIVHIWRSCSRP